MQLNPTYMRSEAEMKVNHPREETYSKKVLVLNHTNSLTVWTDQFHQETEKRMSNYPSTKLTMATKRKVGKKRVNNTNRERVRQKRIREAFDVLRAVIPDYFSEREPGDRLSRITTLRLAKMYIVMLRELLERGK